ncbi:ribonuclease H-like domain-containing protein [Tanacetum coccineum]
MLILLGNKSENSSGSCSYKTFKFDDPHKAMKNKGIVDSGCSRHMTGNKAYLIDYQDYNGGPVVFGGSKGYIIGKVAERKNRTLIEAARTMPADSFLPNTFWAEAVSIACYVLNRVLVTKPQNKTPYELITGKTPIISYIRPFGCHVTILNTIDHLRKFKRKADEGFLVGYSLSSKAFRVYNLETKRVEKNLHVKFLENKPNIAGKEPTWLFDLDYLTDSMNYVRLENQVIKPAGPKDTNHSAETKNGDDKSKEDTHLKSQEKPVDEAEQAFRKELKRLKKQEKEDYDEAEALQKKISQGANDARASSTKTVSTASTSVSTASTPVSTASPSRVLDDSPISKSRIHSIHPSSQNPGNPKSAIQARSKVEKGLAHALVSYIQKQRRNHHKDFQHSLFACFLSQIEPKKICEALLEESWVDAIQEELLQFKL